MASNLNQKIVFSFQSNSKEFLKDIKNIEDKVKNLKEGNEWMTVRFKNYNDIRKKIQKIRDKTSNLKGTINLKTTGYSGVISKINKIKSKKKIKVKVDFSSSGYGSVIDKIKGIKEKGIVSSLKGLKGVAGATAVFGVYKKATDFFKNIEKSQDKVQALFYSKSSNKEGRSQANALLGGIRKEAIIRQIDPAILLEVALNLKERGSKKWSDPKSAWSIASNAEINNFDVKNLVDVLTRATGKNWKTLDITTSLGLIQNLKSKGWDTRGDLVDTLQEFLNLTQNQKISFPKFIKLLEIWKKGGAYNYNKIGDLIKESYIRSWDLLVNNPKMLNRLGISFDKKSFLHWKKNLREAFTSWVVTKTDLIKLYDKAIWKMSPGERTAFQATFFWSQSEDLGSKASASVIKELYSNKIYGQERIDAIKTAGKQEKIFRGSNDVFLSKPGISWNKFITTTGEVYNKATDLFQTPGLSEDTKNKIREEKQRIEKEKLQLARDSVVEQKKSNELLSNLVRKDTKKQGANLWDYNNIDTLNNNKFNK